MRFFLKLLLPILLFQVVFISCNPDRAPKTNNRPNIVWIFVKDMKAYFEAGKMNEVQAVMWSEKRPAEEFYDLENDPHEINNLATDPKYADELARHQEILENWINETDDQGQYPESIAALKGVLIQWSAQAVNPEYEKAR